MKFIAALCMLIDHIGVIFFPLDLRWRIIGRLAMPIFAYGVARGAVYTTSLVRYMKKMLLFSFVSQIPFWGMHYLGSGEAFFSLNLNIGFTFFFALLSIYLLKKNRNIIGILICIIAANVLGCDYGSYGVILVLMGYLGYVRGISLGKMALGYLILTGLFFGQSIALWLLQGMGVTAYGIIYKTSYLSEKRWSKFFYWFYPLHMTIIVCVRWLQIYN